MDNDKRMQHNIRMVGDMMVELPYLDRKGEEARRDLDKLARKTYEQTGKLSGERLCEAETAFHELAKEHLLVTEQEGKDPQDSQ